MKRGSVIGLTLVVYAIVIAAVVVALVRARTDMIAAYSGPQEQANWDAFRETMDRRYEQREALRVEIAKETGQPEAARPPKPRSARPPTIELLENHFAACLTIAILGVSGLFAVIWGFLLGSILRPGRRFTETGDAPPGD